MNTREEGKYAETASAEKESKIQRFRKLITRLVKDQKTFTGKIKALLHESHELLLLFCC